jgi:hypothetical protein
VQGASAAAVPAARAYPTPQQVHRAVGVWPAELAHMAEQAREVLCLPDVPVDGV